MTDTQSERRAGALDELAWRGLIAHSTDLDELRADMRARPIAAYCGFDPTAPSLHMGNLLQILALRRLQDAGHRPFGIVGGATGMIGDPRDVDERKLNSLDTVKQWTEAIRGQLERFLSFEGDNAATVVNNYDWTASMSTIDFLRDIGKHFPVNRMLARDVVRNRLESGISYTEFSYVLMQSLDYLTLFREYGVTLQTGGSDQWGNITAGVELIRRSDGERVHALATPLVTKADGTKFGKTASGSIWLDASMTSPYAFHQFWFNCDDREVLDLLRFFTFRTKDEVDALAVEVAERPFARIAQRTLADDVTSLVHGADEAARAVAAAKALFGDGDVRSLDAATLGAALSETPNLTIGAGPDFPTYADLLAGTGLVQSKGAARRTVAEGGAYVNNVRIEDADASPSAADLLPGGWLLLRRGKRNLAGVHVGS